MQCEESRTVCQTVCSLQFKLHRVQTALEDSAMGDRCSNWLRCWKALQTFSRGSNFFINRGVLARVWCPNADRVRRFYTFDHRRLWCLHMADCPTLRLEVMLAGPLVDGEIMDAVAARHRLHYGLLQD